MITGLHTTFAWVGDMNRGVAFYRDVLGLPVIMESPHWSMFRAGHGMIALHAHAGPKPQDGWVLGVSIENMDSFEAHLKAHGVDYDPHRHDTPGGFVMTFRDPDGNTIQAIEPKQ